MGSLMAGWDCPVLDPEKARLERNRSLTKEDIDSFWKLYNGGAGEEEEELEEHGGEEEEEETMSPTPRKSDGEAMKHKKSIFCRQLEQRRKALLDHHDSARPGKETTTKQHLQAAICGDWWTRSNWAFLNEPPLDEVEESAHKYTAQFHVAEIAAATTTTHKQHKNTLN